MQVLIEIWPAKISATAYELYVLELHTRGVPQTNRPLKRDRKLPTILQHDSEMVFPDTYRCGAGLFWKIRHRLNLGLRKFTVRQRRPSTSQ